MKRRASELPLRPLFRLNGGEIIRRSSSTGVTLFQHLLALSLIQSFKMFRHAAVDESVVPFRASTSVEQRPLHWIISIEDQCFVLLQYYYDSSVCHERYC